MKNKSLFLIFTINISLIVLFGSLFFNEKMDAAIIYDLKTESPNSRYKSLDNAVLSLKTYIEKGMFDEARIPFNEINSKLTISLNREDTYTKLEQVAIANAISHIDIAMKDKDQVEVLRAIHTVSITLGLDFSSENENSPIPLP